MGIRGGGELLMARSMSGMGWCVGKEEGGINGGGG